MPAMRRARMPLAKERLVPCLEFGAPSLTLIEVLGTAIVGKDRQGQLGKSSGACPILRRFQECAADTLPFRLACNGKNRNMTVGVIGKVVAP